MRALVVAPEPFFSPRGTPLSVYYRTLVLSELGVRVDLVTYGQGDDVALDSVRILRIPRFQFLGSVPVGPSLLKLFLDGLLFARTALLLLTRRYQVLFAHEESAFFCRWLKPIFRFRFVYEMHSSLPQQLLNFEFTRSRLLIGLFERLERSCLAAADAVITISPALADHAIAHMPDPGRQFTIENSLLEEVRLREPAADEAALDSVLDRIPGDRRLIGYAGTLESYQGAELLLQAFARVLRDLPSAFLLIIGGSEDQVRRYRELANGLGVGDECLFTGSLSQQLARQLLHTSEVVTSPRTTGSNTPLKIYELLACGRPLVATRIPAHTQVLTDEVCFLAEPDADAFAEAILAALAAEGRRGQVVGAARALYETRYSRSVYVQKMRSVLEGLA